MNLSEVEEGEASKVVVAYMSLVKTFANGIKMEAGDQLEDDPGIRTKCEQQKTNKDQRKRSYRHA